MYNENQRFRNLRVVPMGRVVDGLVAIAFYMGRDAAHAFAQAMANNHDANHSRLAATGHPRVN